jgi:hypothetical protein
MSGAPDLPSRVRRVAVTCDFTRLTRTPQGLACSQLSNLNWLHRLLAGTPVWSRSDLQVSVIAPSSRSAALVASIGDDESVRDYCVDPEDAWARRYDTSALSDFSELRAALLEQDLVVGFELSPAIRRFLHCASKPYLSLHVHPVRYLRDLCFGAVTNSPQIDHVLRGVIVPQNEVTNQATRFQARFAKHQHEAFAMPEGWALLVGQTAKDSMLISGGRFRSWEAFGPELRTMLAACEGIVLLEHPHRRDSVSVAQFLRTELAVPVLSTNANGYGIVFSNPNCPKVVTLSSSLGVEAVSVGLPVEFLLGDPRQRIRIPGIDDGPEEPLGHGLLSDGFWCELLRTKRRTSSFSSPSRRRSEPFQLGDSFVRSGLESWSYRLLQASEPPSGVRRALLPAPRAVQSPAEDGTRSKTTDLVDGQSILGACPLQPGEHRRLELSDTWGPLVLHGFHPPESWGAWVDGKSGSLDVAVAQEVVDTESQVIVALDIALLPTILERCPVVRVSVDGRPRAEAYFRPTGINPTTIELPVRPRSCRIRIDLQVSDCTAPDDSNGGGDSRRLGLSVKSVDVDCSVEPSAEVESDASLSVLLLGIADVPVRVRVQPVELEISNA